MDQITLEDLVKFQDISCNVVQGIYWIDDTRKATLRKHTIRDTIQTVFDQRAAYKEQGSPHQEAFKLIMNSVYGMTIMKDIKTYNEYVPSDAVSEYFDTRYNLIDGVYEANSEQSMVKLRKGTVH